MVHHMKVEDLYTKNKNLRKEDIRTLDAWVKLQPHFPEIEEYMLILFLHSCKYSLEATKKCIDNYYTTKTMCPEVFSNRDPANPEIIKIMDVVSLTPLPKPTPDGYSIFYARIQDSNPDNFNYNTIVKLYDMVASIHILEIGPCPGHVFIVDCSNFTLSHVMKFNLITIKKYMFFLQEAIPFRLRAFHFVNCNPILDKILFILKPFMKKELLDELQVHWGNNESIYKCIPKDLLPKEVGGNLESVKTIHDKYMEKIKSNAKFFLETEKMVADESKRPGKPRSESEMFGVEGSFKKLDID